MQINKFTKKKNSMYEITLEDKTTLLIHEDLILKYDLLLKKKIDDVTRNKILEENQIYEAYNLAIKYISSRMRTRKEISNYLAEKDISLNASDEVISMLEKEKYINDLEYAVAFINDKINLSNDGPLKIVNELVNKGIKKEIATDKIAVFTPSLELERIKKITDKLINSNHNKSSYVLKNKIIDYLVNLGYTKSLIEENLSKKDLSDDYSIYKKEYDKVYNKLSRKYSGSELEYKVKAKMYSLGFRNDQ